MKKANAVLIIIGLMILSLGIGGIVLATDNDNVQGDNYNMMKQYGEESIRIGNDFYNDGSMMTGGYRFNRNRNSGEKIDVDVLTKEVEDYIGKYDNELIIGDIFIFEDSDYYYSIIEKKTGRGAMELLVNPYTKDIFPEYGPNMMWNLKYGGMMSGSGMMGGSGKMGRSGMMGGSGDNSRSGMLSGRGMMGDAYNNDYSENNDILEKNEISSEKAYSEGTDYLLKRNETLTLGDEYHEFYGYYTFHVEKDGVPAGMLSVNGFTGAVWYHNWHGELIEIIEGLEEDIH